MISEIVVHRGATLIIHDGLHHRFAAPNLVDCFLTLALLDSLKVLLELDVEDKDLLDTVQVQHVHGRHQFIRCVLLV